MKDLKDKPEGTKPVDTDSTKSPKQGRFSAFGSINTEISGILVGEIQSQKYEFLKPNDRVVGVLISRKQINIEDNPWLYEIQNIHGLFSFWGCTLIDSRMAEVPDNVILDITYLGNKNSQRRRAKYKDYRVKHYPLPDNFDRDRWTVALNDDGVNIDFVDLGEDIN